MDTDFVGMGVDSVEKSVPIWESLHVLFFKSCTECRQEAGHTALVSVWLSFVNIRMKIKLFGF